MGFGYKSILALVARRLWHDNPHVQEPSFSQVGVWLTWGLWSTPYLPHDWTILRLGLMVSLVAWFQTFMSASQLSSQHSSQQAAVTDMLPTAGVPKFFVMSGQGTT